MESDRNSDGSRSSFLRVVGAGSGPPGHMSARGRRRNRIKEELGKKASVPQDTEGVERRLGMRGKGESSGLAFAGPSNQMGLEALGSGVWSTENKIPTVTKGDE